MSELTKLIYRDLELELTGPTGPGSHRVRVLGRAPDGSEMRADQAEVAAFATEDFLPLVDKLQRRRASTDELMTLGEHLAGLLLPGRVGEIYRSSLAQLRAKGEGLRLRLRVEPLALTALPWEYALLRGTPGEAVPADFLALQRDVSITRYETVGRRLEPVKAKPKYRALVALASPVPAAGGWPQLDVAADERAILTAIKALNKASAVIEPVVLGHATRDELLDGLVGSDIFHFAGHGVFESESDGPNGRPRTKGKIVLETDTSDEDRYDADLLANALQASAVRLVVLGACSTAARDQAAMWAGVAPALVRVNVPAVVAMQYDVADNRAPLFIAQLYLRVLQGHPVDQAVYEGRRALFNRTGQENGDWARDRDWGTPVLYLRASDGVLFPEAGTEVDEVAGANALPFVRVSQKIALLEGEAVALEADAMIEANVDIHHDVDKVAKGASLIGVRYGKSRGASDS